MNEEERILMEEVKKVKELTSFTPEIGIVLGSGLGGLAKEVKKVLEIPYSSLPSLPTSSIPGHKGAFLFGTLREKKVILMEGRVHYYEGYSAKEVVRPERLMALLGAKKILLTNAAGGVNDHFVPGDLMMIQDHIASLVPSPLRGENIDSFGPRFPDMSRVYSPSLQRKMKEAASSLSIPLKTGIYMQFTGPQFETPAEIRMAKVLGADAVGMSTAIEAIALSHMGVEVAGLSLITNKAAGLSKEPLSHEEVQEIASLSANKMEALVKKFVSLL